jgi:phosphohistidine swiveling domain-containing protein
MKKAAAIVCNTGGILSHSAIIARELKIPCINGVHGATKIIKTGDFLEINTEKGLVTKLS